MKKLKIDWIKVQCEYDNGLSSRELAKKLNISDSTIRKAALSGKIKMRTMSDAIKLSHINGKCGAPVSNDTKIKISNSMKKAHADGRAWNIGKSRWNNKPSYPEIFFMKVIKNEFYDKNYRREYPVGIYSIDFAWPLKKFAIEIDGEQHQRFPEYVARDKRKDEYLINNGWVVKRISWKSICDDTKVKIKELNEFIDLPICY